MSDRLHPMYGSPATLFPLMTQDQPDTADRVRLAVQAIEFALPPKKEEPLSNVPPCLSEQNIVYRSEMYAEALSDRSLSACSHANGTHIVGSEPSLSVCFSALAALSGPAPTLPLSVSHVLGVGAQEKVIRREAAWDVALVADGHAWRDWPVVEPPRQSMDCSRLGIPNANPTVTETVDGSEPKQTPAIGLWDRALNQFAPKRGVGYGIISHLTALLRRSVVRVGAAVQSRLRPAFSTKFGCPVEGTSPWR